MLQIIHLSDFHLNPKNLNDWNTYINAAFIKKIEELNLDLSKTIIVCTGDLVDKGGASYETIEEALMLFKTEVIDYICEKLSISVDHFFIVPGNHDIERKLDSKKVELGSREFYKNYDNILSSQNSILDKGEREGVQRLKAYFEFDKIVYQGIDRYSSFLGNAYKIEIDGTSIGIALLNSAWRAYDDDDKDYLILGEEQLSRCTSHIQDCKIKIALMHHPLDWFNMENNIISNHINKDYDILFVGHVHKSKTIIQTGFTGTLFTNVASSCTSDIRADSKAFSNGFSLTKYNLLSEDIDCSYYKYNHENKEYVLNTDIADKGRFIQKIPKQRSSNDLLLENCLSNIKSNFYPIMDDHEIAKKVNNASNIKDAFIMPPITIQDNDTEYISLDDICTNKQNQFFFGAYEIGKTTLLYRILREFTDEYAQLRKIPVFIDINEMGNKDIVPIIKQFFNIKTEEANKLIDDNLIILICDNLDYTELNEDRINKLSKFHKEKPNIQIIAAASNDIIGVPPQNYAKKTKIPFSHYFIRPLKSNHIKGLMTKWVPGEDTVKRNARLDKMVANFCSYSLPCTAMSVSLFLWSTENADRKPINQAILLDIYIEIVLEKLAKENIYRATFNYKNKAMLLAYIAEQMLPSTNQNYAIEYDVYIKHIKDYLKSVGHKYDVSKIADYFIERKIFSKIANNQIKFTHSCFFHFFLAKRMEYNVNFRKEILIKETFYMYPKEIDYYTGLTTNDENTLNFVFTEFENTFNGLHNILNDLDVDDFFTHILNTEHKKYEPNSKNIDIDKVKQNRPSEEQIMSFYDNKLAKKPKDIIQRKIDDLNLEKLIIIMCTVLRNSEGVENYELKRNIYNTIIRNTVAWSVLYKESIVQYVKKHNTMPPFIPKEENLVRFLKFLPMNIQSGVNTFLGTYKLTPIMQAKINNDFNSKTCSNIEAYFSVCLYWDSLGDEYLKYLAKLIKRLSNNVVQDYFLIRLLDHYYRKTKSNSKEEADFIDLLTVLTLKNEKLPKRLTEQVRKRIRQRKDKFIKKNTIIPLKDKND